MSAPAASFEYYPATWFDDDRDELPVWYSLCPACMEYEVHMRPGGGWVACGPGELSQYDCSRCGEPLS